jgi:hypothetical protein
VEDGDDEILLVRSSALVLSSAAGGGGRPKTKRGTELVDLLISGWLFCLLVGCGSDGGVYKCKYIVDT